MANTKSAIKAARKATRLTTRNRGVKTNIKTLQKKFAAAVDSKDAKAAAEAGKAYVSAMDRAVKSGVVHRNAASRAKARASAVIFKK
jgi:small subunit ribosomal protein S20